MNANHTPIQQQHTHTLRHQFNLSEYVHFIDKVFVRDLIPLKLIGIVRNDGIVDRINGLLHNYNEENKAFNFQW